MYRRQTNDNEQTTSDHLNYSLQLLSKDGRTTDDGGPANRTQRDINDQRERAWATRDEQKKKQTVQTTKQRPVVDGMWAEEKFERKFEIGIQPNSVLTAYTTGSKPMGSSE